MGAQDSTVGAGALSLSRTEARTWCLLSDNVYTGALHVFIGISDSGQHVLVSLSLSPH